MNTTTDKKQVRILLEILSRKGIKDFVISPGSRNTPLIIGAARNENFRKHVVLDERCAAFTGLGIAQQSGKPVALICTSGTAVLNYAPAVAEACYQQQPLIILTADRPPEVIDQDDTQTLRQHDIYRNYIKYTVTLPVEINKPEDEYYVVREVNQAVNAAMRPPYGPVHINIPLREPLSGTAAATESPRIIESVQPQKTLAEKTLAELSRTISESPKIMLLASFGQYDKELSDALARLARYPQVVLMTESISNIHAAGAIKTIDKVLTAIPNGEEPTYAPDILITFGGSLVSKMIKRFIKTYPPREHWNINQSAALIDTFQALTRQIDTSSPYFFKQIAGRAVANSCSNYSALWHEMEEKAEKEKNTYVETVPWSDLKAFSILMPAIPAGTALQLSNGTPVRYAQLFRCDQYATVNSNRGVSGIDGAVSTAAGAAIATPGRTTLLITGDMGFLYDSNGLTIADIPPTLKIIVMKNGGGNIFRFLPGTSALPELEHYFETVQDVKVKELAQINGFEYFEADNEGSLQKAIPRFFESPTKALLEIRTPRVENDKILRNYFKQ